MGAKVSRTDFEWVYTEEPHASRRKAILEKHPEIKQLYGCDPNFKWAVTVVVLVQMVSLPLIEQLSWPMLLLLGYCFGGVLNHSLMLAIHDIGHNQAFGYARPVGNRLFGIFANLPIGVPCFISFRKYHVEHHRALWAGYLTEVEHRKRGPEPSTWGGSRRPWQPAAPGHGPLGHRVNTPLQGVDNMDPDLPSLFEAKLCSTSLGKLAFVVLLPVFYSIRPLVVRPLPLAPLELVNIITQLLFNACVVLVFGWKTLWYLIIGSLMSIGLHPLGAHLISEHYMFHKGHETYSYYGPLNSLAFNFGYHVEHHDFPAIPASRLPQVKRIAAEYYDNLPHHTSCLAVFYHFIMDADKGAYARIKRKGRGLKA